MKQPIKWDLGEAYFVSLFMLVFSAIPLSAQRIDTVQIEHEDVRYMVFNRNAKGAADGPVSYFDGDSVLRRQIEFKEGKPHGTAMYFDEGGVLSSRREFKDGKVHGTSIYYYASGRTWAEMPYREGEFHGVIRSYHPNGALESVKPYKRGKMAGERVLRDSTGALVNGEYNQELPYDSARVYSTCVNGRPHGVVTVTRNERKTLEGSCTNGLPEGDFIAYDEKGEAIRRDVYVNGKFVRSESLK